MADVTIGARLQLDAQDGIKSMQEFKARIKEAKGDLLAMTEQFGATSEQAREAAKRVAELEDNIGDAKTLIDAFNPDKKFQALGQALNGVLGGFTALTGAMGLLGVESEEVQKQLLKVQSALALSQGLNQIGDSINSFKNLGKILVDTLGKSGMIGIAIAGVAALGAAVFGLFDGASAKTKTLNESLRELGRAELEATKEVKQLQAAFKQAEQGVISKDEALKKYNTGLGQTIGQAKDLDEAERLTSENAAAYIEVQGLKAQANFLIAKSAEAAANALVIQAQIEKEGANGRIGGAVKDLVKNLQNAATDFDVEIEKIQAKIASASQGFKTVSTGGAAGNTKATTPGGILKEKEVQEVQALEALYNQWQRQDFEEKNRLRSLNEAAQAESLNRQLANSQQYTDNEGALADARIAFAEKERQAKVQAAYAVGSALGSLADLVGKQTAAGKVLGIAQATINTFIGATEVLRAKSVLPEPLGTISKIANVAAIIASGLAAVKNIVKVQVPGASGGGTGALSTAQATAPLQPQSPLATRTRLEQDQINQIGNATVRAFVVESDVTGNQERIRRLNRAARI